MIAALATAAGVVGVIAATLVYDRRRDAKLADAVHRLREIFSEVREYRAATPEEVATKAVEAIAGLRLLGSLACGRDGTLSVSHYFVDESGTIVANRLDSACTCSRRPARRSSRPSVSGLARRAPRPVATARRFR